MARNELPGMVGKGVGALEIPEIDKAISKFERKKAEVEALKPGLDSAKHELQESLHEHQERLPVNGDGVPFYRSDDHDYLLDDKVTVKKVKFPKSPDTED